MKSHAHRPGDVAKIDALDIGAEYEAIGRHSRERIERLLPDEWSNSALADPATW